MRAINVKTPAIMCDQCVTKIKKAVFGIPGVLGVSALVSDGTTSVIYDESRTEHDTIVAAINSAGFEVEAA